MSWNAFFAMGGYGDYIWAAYSITAVGIIVMFWQARVERCRTLQQLRMRYFL